MKNNFTHLNLRTAYSLINSTVNVDKLIKLAKSKKIKSLAITDYLNMFEAIKFYQKCIANKIKPIIGCQIPLKEFSDNSNSRNITVLCQNQIGYHNLINILHKIHVEKKHNQNIQCTIDLLRDFNEGLLILTGGREGILGKNMLQTNNDVLNNYKILKSFFSDRIYIEIQRTKHESEDKYNNLLLDIAERTNSPIIATNNVIFLESTDFEAHEIKVCINKKIKLDDRNNQTDYTNQQYFKSEELMNELFNDLPDAIRNIQEVTQRCNLHLDLDTYHLPSFNAPQNSSPETYFDHVVNEGLNTILRKNKAKLADVYKNRLHKEIKIIKEMEFVSYFLIVHEFISWAKNNNIPVGPGRGSGAGSLVAYALDITTIDPIEHNLLFERFLNPERISMPDFDIDFCMVNRQKIIEHITNLYGENRVSQIITYNSLSARAVIRDVGRVLGMRYTSVDRISKLIPFGPGITIDDGMSQNKELKKEYDENEEIKNLIETSKKLEGLPRNVGKHAAGIVISRDNINNYVPLYRVEESNELVTQYDKDDIEKLGLVKFDILGLRTLSIIDKTVKDIKDKQNKEININNINLGDKKVFELLQKTLTTGVFQLESSGMRRYMGQLQPDCFDDIVALVALYRPGPLGTNMVDDFINNKHGKKINYEHPLLESILSSTYGLILYQEQVMEISRTLANYTLGEADLLRRAMGKKKKKEMEEHRQKFIDGATAKGVNTTIANSIFSKMEKFAGYGFNKSHSVAYAYIAYQTAYLKTYYAPEFLASALSSDMDNTDKVISLIDAANEININIDKPNINKSDYNFEAIDQNSILYSLGAIKGVGLNAVKHIVEERNKNGPYTNLFDFCERISHNTINIGTLDALIYSGSCDIFNENRLVMKNLLSKAISYGQQKQTSKTSGQQELFENKSDSFSAKNNLDLTKYQIKDTMDSRLKILSLEKKVLGLYMSGHPINEFLPEIQSMSIKNIESYFEKYLTNKDPNYSEQITVSGVITNDRRQKAGKDKFIKIITIDDSSARLDVVVYSDIYERYQDMIKENEILFFSGTLAVDDYNGSLSLKATSILDIENIRQKYSKKIELLITSDLSDDKILSQLTNLLEPHKNGKCPLIIKCISDKHVVPLNLNNEWHINPSSILINNLSDLLGRENIIVKYQ